MHIKEIPTPSPEEMAAMRKQYEKTRSVCSHKLCCTFDALVEFYLSNSSYEAFGKQYDSTKQAVQLACKTYCEPLYGARSVIRANFRAEEHERARAQKETAKLDAIAARADFTCLREQALARGYEPHPALPPSSNVVNSGHPLIRIKDRLCRLYVHGSVHRPKKDGEQFYCSFQVSRSMTIGVKVYILCADVPGYPVKTLIVPAKRIRKVIGDKPTHTFYVRLDKDGVPAHLRGPANLSRYLDAWWLFGPPDPALMTTAA